MSMNKIVTSIFLFALLGSFADISAKQISDNKTADGWKFHAGEGKDSLWFSSTYKDVSWKAALASKTLAEQGLSTQNGYGWYRKGMVFSRQEAEAISRSGAAVLRLGRFASSDEVFINGQLIGKTGDFPDNFTGYNDESRTYFIPAESLLLNKENLIAIKFHDGWGQGGFFEGAKFSISAATENDKILMDVNVPDPDYVFLGKQSLAVNPVITNKNTVAVKGQINVILMGDNYRPVKTETMEVSLAPGEKLSKIFEYSKPFPGFYRYDIQFIKEGKVICQKKLNVGYEPERISSPNDEKADFDAFWKNNLSELAKVAPEYKLTLIPEESNQDYNLFLVEMKSFNNETIRGYYAQPKRTGKFPVIVEYMGYGSGPYLPNRSWDGFAYFILSVRGQALNKPYNTYGTWITSGADNKDTYYYRGAYMDLIRAIDFVCSRAEIDTTKIAARGASQGGAFTIAAASLDKRIKVAVPMIPFLSDFRDYFTIAPWPKSDFDNYMQQHPDANWADIFDMLSYFDVKNLASRITCPVMMGFGVQDNVCPPHINFAAYNQIHSEKQWRAGALFGHSTGKVFANESYRFIKAKLDVK